MGLSTLMASAFPYIAANVNKKSKSVNQEGGINEKANDPTPCKRCAYTVARVKPPPPTQEEKGWLLVNC